MGVLRKAVLDAEMLDTEMLRPCLFAFRMNCPTQDPFNVRGLARERDYAKCAHLSKCQVLIRIIQVGYDNNFHSSVQRPNGLK